MSARRARLVALARAVIAALRGHDLVLYAAGLTFYAAIAVVPLLLIAVFGAGLLLGQDTVTALGVDLAPYVPRQLGLRDALATLAEVGPRLNVMALIAALIPATTYGEGLARIFGRLAGEPVRRPGVRGRLKALVLLAVLPLVVTTGLLGVAVLPGLLGLGPGARLLGVYTTFWIGWVSSALLLALGYRAFSERPLGARALFWGTATTGSFLAGMSMGWVLILRFGIDVGRAYGGSTAVGTAVLAALYLFLVQIVLLAGYVLTLRLEATAPERAGPSTSTRSPAPATRRGGPPRGQEGQSSAA